MRAAWKWFDVGRGVSQQPGGVTLEESAGEACQPTAQPAGGGQSSTEGTWAVGTVSVRRRPGRRSCRAGRPPGSFSHTQQAGGRRFQLIKNVTVSSPMFKAFSLLPSRNKTQPCKTAKVQQTEFSGVPWRWPPEVAVVCYYCVGQATPSHGGQSRVSPLPAQPRLFK